MQGKQAEHLRPELVPNATQGQAQFYLASRNMPEHNISVDKSDKGKTDSALAHKRFAPFLRAGIVSQRVVELGYFFASLQLHWMAAPSHLSVYPYSGCRASTVEVQSRSEEQTREKDVS